MKVGKIISLLKKEVEIGWSETWAKDPFRVLISTVLSQRTRDENTAVASERLFSKFDTPKKLAGANLREIEKLIKPSGFYKVKARYIRQIARELVERFDGEVPDDIDDLLTLPGVGRKTAQCTLVYGHKKLGLPIDTHCHRIPNRLGWIKTKTPEQTETELRKLLPKRYWLEFNELFVKFGQRICRPIRPLCHKCPIMRYCAYFKKTRNPTHAYDASKQPCGLPEQKV